MLSIQKWDLLTDRGGFLRHVLLRNRRWSELEEGVKQAFKDQWTTENEGKFALYYIDDLSEPLASRIDVSNQEELDVYLHFRFESKHRDSFLQLFMNVAIIFQASGKPISPVKPPLSIDTALARAHDGGTARQTSSRSASHLSPDSANSPQSPGTPREKEFRQVVLQRDSDGCIRPDAIVTPASIYRCVFCEGSFLPLPKQIEAAHVVPHALFERLGKVLDGETVLRIGGGLEVLTNGVSACSVCHGIFDSGLMWVEQNDDAALAVRTIFVHESIRSVQHSIGKLHGCKLRLPSDPSFPFPGAIAWRGRKEWAVLRRDRAAEKVAEKLAQLELQGSPPIPCSCGLAGKNKNRKCPNNLCKACCDKTSHGCGVHPPSARTKQAASSSIEKE